MFDHQELQVHQHEREGVAILDLKGHLVIGEGDSELRKTVQSLFDRGNRRLILNFKAVSNIDTVGTGTLLLLAEQYRNAGGKLVLFQLQHAHGELYEMARLEAAIEIYGEELDAVNSFFPDRAVPHYNILEFLEHQERQPEPEKNK